MRAAPPTRTVTTANGDHPAVINALAKVPDVAKNRHEAMTSTKPLPTFLRIVSTITNTHSLVRTKVCCWA